MAARVLLMALVIAGASLASAQDAANSRCRFCTNSGGPAITSIACSYTANGVTTIGTARCSAGTTSITLTPTAAITRVTTYSSRLRAVAGSADAEAATAGTRPLARIEFTQANGVVLVCGTSHNTFSARQYTYKRGGATNLAGVSSNGRCSTSGAVTFASPRLSWTSSAFLPPAPSPSPKPSPSPTPSPSPAPAAQRINITGTYAGLVCSDDLKASFAAQLKASILAATPGAVVDVPINLVTCTQITGHHRMLRVPPVVLSGTAFWLGNVAIAAGVGVWVGETRASGFPINYAGNDYTSTNTIVSNQDIPVPQPSPSPSPYGSPK